MSNLTSSALGLLRFLPSSAVALLRFAELSIRKAWADSLLERSAALAFVSVLSIIPLLAVFSMVGAQFFNQDPERTVEILSRVLPYTEQTLMEHLETFLRQARTLRGLGFIALLVTSLGVFGTVEKTLNRIWNVPRHRRLRRRLLSFTLLLFWGPLVIGTTYSGLFMLRQQPGLRQVADSLPLQLVPALVTLIALGMLYWLVPYTTVRLRYAFWGALVATLLIELLRRGFGLYVDRFQNYSIIYGTFGLALFFMISIQLSWWIVLLGSEVTYCLQNREQISSPRRPSAPLEDSWIALAALAVILERFGDHQPLTGQEYLAETLRLDSEELQQALDPLVEQKILRYLGDKEAGYLLSCDPYRVGLNEVLDAYEAHHQALLEPLPEPLAANLEAVRQRLVTARRQGLTDISVAGLLLGTDTTGPPEHQTEEVPAAP